LVVPCVGFVLAFTIVGTCPIFPMSIPSMKCYSQCLCGNLKCA
jgi:hypothetical protein